MATNQQVDDLLTAIRNANETVAALDDARGVLQGYKDEKQRFADLVDAQKTLVDGLLQASSQNLKDLRDKISVVYPLA